MHRSSGRLARSVALAVVCLLVTLYGMFPVAPATAQEDPQWVPSGFAGVTAGQVVADPSTPGRVYAALPFGDLFRSDDSGISWAPLYDFRYADPPTLAVDPTTPTKLYASNVAYAYISVDGGASWAQSSIGDIRSWAIDPKTPNQVYAGGAIDRLYRSSNGGASWTLALSLADTRDLALAPSDGTVYAGLVNDPPTDASDGIYRSRDRGLSWTKLYTTSMITTLAVDPTDSQTVYLGTDGEGMLKSLDGGASWMPINNGLSTLVIRDLLIDPDDRQTLYTGTWGGGVFRSRDGGEHWTALNSGLQNVFVLSLALDATGDGTLYAGTNSGGVHRIQLLPPPPGPNDTYVHVVGDDGRPVAGAQVWLNGQPVVDGEGRPRQTDSAGNLILNGATVGDQVVAMLVQYEAPTARQAHDGWAYRIYTSSLGIQEDGELLITTVARVPGHTDLTIKSANSVVLFHLLVSIEWAADTAYIEQIRRALHAASDFLYDISDGQMAFGEVTIATGGAYWSDADIQIATNNVVRPHAFVGGITSGDKAHVIRIGRAWDGRSGNAGPWDAPDGYRTLAHEFGHYGLFLYDEYFGYRFDSSGNLAGERSTTCTGPSNRLPSGVATNASVMDYQYTSSELSMREVSGLWGELCTITAQFQLNGESAWETVARRYADPTALSRWRIRTPAERGGVVAGPAALPDTLLDLPVVTLVGKGTAGPSLALRVLNLDGTGHRGAIVALYKRDGRVLGQGFTDSTGHLTIYGAEPGDTIRAATFDAGHAGRIEVGATATLDLQLRPVGSMQLVSGGPLPHLRLIPMPTTATGHTELLILLQNFAPDSDPTAFVTEPGGNVSRSPDLSYSPTLGAYQARVSFSTATYGSGQLRADRRVGPDRPIIQTFYRLQLVNNRAPWDVFSNDGNLRLSGGPESLPGNESVVVVMPTGSVPAPPPVDYRIIGEPYSLTASGAVATLEKSAVLSLRYDAALINTAPPAGLSIFYWRSDQFQWELVTSRIDSEQRTVTAQIKAFGIYALFAPAGPWTETGPKKALLPVIKK